ncbi:hypothetical protein [Pseudomonas sp. NPDC089547]|uniref:hypothetical protein n=1 Tax=Pseudomonas sp. NPDC089547 TaxID=3390652 RepID=UPI003D0473A3
MSALLSNVIDADVSRHFMRNSRKYYSPLFITHDPPLSAIIALQLFAGSCYPLTHSATVA